MGNLPFIIISLSLCLSLCLCLMEDLHLPPLPFHHSKNIIAHFLPHLPSGNISVDPKALSQASTDYGHLIQAAPAAVFYPSRPDDIAALIRFLYSSSRPFNMAARGVGHSVRGQALAPGNIVVDMLSLGHGRTARIKVSSGDHRYPTPYVDAGGEQLWIDVLHETLKHGLAPRSWTDYLYLTVGGTLSNAGISGQAFRHGPQISNVYELDVITGKGEMVTCSHEHNSDLFYGVLGGLGQFGIITRARIAVEPAPDRVRWVRLVYHSFEALTRDQELLIAMEKGFSYVEGSLRVGYHRNNSNWRSSFFSEPDLEKVNALAAKSGAIYYLDGALYYKLATCQSSVDEELAVLLKKLNFVPDFAFSKDVSYVGFLDRVRAEELKLRSMKLWDVPHPWLNILVPKSRIKDFGNGVFQAILQPNDYMGVALVYPVNKNKWDERMSAMIPKEEVFYAVGLLRLAKEQNWKSLDSQNKEILAFCDREGIGYKQYLPHYGTRTEWMKHFGRKWKSFVELKRKYDPKALLSRGQGIFTAPLI